MEKKSLVLYPDGFVKIKTCTEQGRCVGKTGPRVCPGAGQLSEMESLQGGHKGSGCPDTGPGTLRWPQNSSAGGGDEARAGPGSPQALAAVPQAASELLATIPRPQAFLGTLVMMGLGRVLKRSLVLMRAVTA